MSKNPLRHAFGKTIREDKLQAFFKMMDARVKEEQEALIKDLKSRGYKIKRNHENSIGHERYILGEEGEPLSSI